ncbi:MULTISPECIES: response regulator [unclassified Methylibium]|uniref:Hpt domain-containing response regulator n=1 Tax=unclassified Methylibium TaxID=2633235 RepID=UPI0003F447E4|nr:MULTISPECIES: response regulator [unclassified Methylibium]EWS54869.1 Phosphate regulon transcriptional regulatory protein PhoB [Methylibium sp. T29]EWS59837.1 Phosphate regulon transcriptional regulatory protein PhoB [Methylibium sp. T29-B]
MSTRRVILVEDDASLRRFVALALEDLDLDLVACVDVPSAMAALQAGPARLLITDLMLPGESGQSLLERLHREPGLKGAARVAVFSAGLTVAVRQRLEGLGVWRLLSKPVSVADLAACVTDALRDEAPAALVPAVGVTAAEAASAAAIDRHFGGNADLYRAFRASCLAQFTEDLRQGDTACRSEDTAQLRRIAHSLKSVLLTLGHHAASQAARELEDHAAADDGSAARPAWIRLREQIALLTDTPAA